MIPFTKLVSYSAAEESHAVCVATFCQSFTEKLSLCLCKQSMVQRLLHCPHACDEVNYGDCLPVLLASLSLAGSRVVLQPDLRAAHPIGHSCEK